MALILSVTPAGRAALRNAKGDGTNAVRIDKIGVTATPFTSGQPLPNEIKRLSTIAGGATAVDTIHVTISDNGSDVYSVFGFGFYLADGTLFASYGQPTVILQKSAQAMMQLAVDVQFADVSASSITFGDTSFNNPAATTDTPGVVELATDPETALGNDRQRAITPGALRALLDSRFGAGAPSDYIKSLLTAATIVVLWQELGLKSAAGYDTGAGKGLDADKLDGQDGSYYLDYNHLQNVPPPVEQSHSADDITSGTLAVARGGTGANALTAGGYLVGNGTGAVLTKTAAAVLADIGAAAKVHTHPMADIIGLANALAALAPLSSPALTGIPTAPTAASGTNSTQVATTAFVQSVITGLINNSPAALDTLKELADALGNDPNFATTITNLIGTKVSKAGDIMTGALSGTAVSMTGNGTFGGGLHVTGGQNSATSQGTWISWNRTANGMNGEMDFINHHGGGSGGWAFFDTADGVTYTNPVNITQNGNVLSANLGTYFGANGTQTILRSMGWGDKVARWRDVIEANASYSLFAYNATGGSPATRMNIDNPTGNALFYGQVAAFNGFQVASDKRLKKNIRKRDVMRGIALRCAKTFSEWEMKESGAHDVGVVAQTLRRFAPWYVKKNSAISSNGKTKHLTIDKAGIALESSMDNALSIEELRRENKAFLKRIAKLEKRK